MPDLALDFSAARPSVDELAAAGVKAIFIYSRISTPPTAFLEDCVARGIGVCPIFETAATRAWGGYPAGEVDGDQAEGDLNRIGIPDGVCLYVNMSDTPNAAGHESAIADYARGFAESFPDRWQLGAYGPLGALRAAQAGSARFSRLWAVETWGAPSGTPAQHFAFWQQQPGVRLVQMANIPSPVAGTDTDWIIDADLGAWGDDMTPDQVNDLIEKYVFAPTNVGASRVELTIEKYVFAPGDNVPSRFGIVFLKAVTDFAGEIKKRLGI